MWLEKINSPADLRDLPESALPELAEECRREILHTVSSRGGHLGSNLGIVELEIALHRVFDTPREPLIFDVGHQCYTHKLLTGRRGKFSTLRSRNGISGFPTPAESPEHDPVVCGHAGAAASAAAGIAAAFDARGETRKVIAVLGDGSLTNGESFEALNGAAGPGGKNLVIVLNDNQMSISHNVGSLTAYLNHIITGSRYNHAKKAMRSLLKPLPRLDRACRHLKEVLKGALLPPGTFFEALGFHYIGPVNGHDLPRLISLLTRVRQMEGPVLLHVVTVKGKGCSFAENAPAHYHGVGKFDPETGALPKSSGGFSSAFSQAMLDMAERHKDLVAVSAAMLRGTGLVEFYKKYSDRCYDVGIAEEHAVTFSAGLAAAGLRPVCALYSTFLQRALDQIYHDVVLAGLPVIFAVDRAGIVEDGPTHHGIYDLGFLRQMPTLQLLAPSTEAELSPMLEYAYQLKRPVVLRYPRGKGAELPPMTTPVVCGKARLLNSPANPAAVLWGLGPEAGTAWRTAELLRQHGIECAVVDARFVKPADAELLRSFGTLPQYVIEDHALSGGLTAELRQCASRATRLRGFGWPDQIIGHGDPAELHREFLLTPEAIAESIQQELSAK